mmetsp:Transcript_518/g.1079  ORF Transcript_518/g.1079 Transcript_518/m.1079 type:complete len:298 (-) Transcript_518:250-1143(-)
MEWKCQDKYALVTGATSGIGQAAACDLAKKGMHVTIICRNKQKGQSLLSDLKSSGAEGELRMIVCDLGRASDVFAAVETYLTFGIPLHVLFNNAGLVNMSKRFSQDGLEEMFAVNHLSMFILTVGLLDLMKKSAPSRIVITSSGAHKFDRFDVSNLQCEKKQYRAMRHYGLSKLCNVLFTRELARRLAADAWEGSRRVTVNCFHPGAVGTNMGQNNGGFARCIMACLRPFFRTPERGADTGVFLATSDTVSAISGQYFYNKKEARTSRDADCEQNGTLLWEYSEGLSEKLRKGMQNT